MSNTRTRMSPHRPWGSTENGQIEFESLTTETLEGALDVIRKCFVVRESTCIGVDLLSEPGAAEEIVELCRDSARDGVTAIAVDISTRKVVGVAFNKIQVCTAGKGYFEKFSENCKCESSKAFMDYMINVDGRLNIFKNYNTNCVLELMSLAVLPEYGQRHIGELLVSTVLQIGTELKRGNDVRVPVMVRGSNEVTNANMVPTLVCCILTSKYSQSITVKLGFKELLRVSFEEFEFKGKKFSDRITTIHKDGTLMAKILK
ncbi:uncharacterized protein LOC105191420 isoform X1 [Harpegnathos saltator]|uniref:uncharacterized protein LOC105191420 isoform X1 n=1 Tax=Harpegnathos saltator TaxID=610380 RepID=UPI0005914E13|nr:uncharacterized protein LOC105191420 isoform X1 [Harpegnathos saltator]